MDNGQKQYPKVGVGVIVIKNGKVLIGKRQEENQKGTWSFPGGAIDFFESLEDCARREVQEETGIKIGNIRPIYAVDDFRKEDKKHWVCVYLRADYVSGEPQPVDGEFELWQWVSWNEIPLPRFTALETLLKIGYKPEGVI